MKTFNKIYDKYINNEKIKLNTDEVIDIYNDMVNTLNIEGYDNISESNSICEFFNIVLKPRILRNKQYFDSNMIHNAKVN